MGGRVPSLHRVGSGVSMILAPLLWFASSALGPGHEASQNLAGVLPHTPPIRIASSRRCCWGCCHSFSSFQPFWASRTCYTGESRSLLSPAQPSY